MLRYHSTPNENKAGIEREGFKDTPNSDQSADSTGHTWFSFWADLTNSAVKDRDWWVIVDVPDEVVEEHRYRYRDGTIDTLPTRLPHEVANRYMPFRFERIT